MIRELRERLGTAMLMITHDLGIVAQTCDNVGVMYAGKIIEIGKASDIYQAENHHPYTVGLFGSIPNLRSKAKRLTPIPGLMPDPTSLPKGCSFSPRCPQKMSICDEVSPCVYRHETHMICCHLLKEDVNWREEELL
jgi:peptide/nickel transport system ATP-binding protein